jgi:hypothetical protein
MEFMATAMRDFQNRLGLYYRIFFLSHRFSQIFPLISAESFRVNLRENLWEVYSI